MAETARREERPGAEPGRAVPLPSRRGLNRAQAAGYIGVSASKFDEMVADGRMPRPKRIDARVVWDKRALDNAFDSLPGGEEPANSWDRVLE